MSEPGGSSYGGSIRARDGPNVPNCLQRTWVFVSIRFLTEPGSKHTITETLESHYFVLMWTALHWVRHNRSDDSFVDMEHTLGQDRPLPSRIVEGGVVKEGMYRNDIEFASKPLNELFSVCGRSSRRTSERWAVNLGNPGPGRYPLPNLNPSDSLDSDVDLEPLVSSQQLIDQFEVALKQSGWIDNEVAYQFSSASSQSTPRIPLSDMGNGEGRGD